MVPTTSLFIVIITRSTEDLTAALEAVVAASKSEPPEEPAPGASLRIVTPERAA